MSNRNPFLCNVNRDKIFRFALCLLKDYEDAQDVAQDIITKLLTKRGNYDLEKLAIKMTRDLCFDRLKHNQIKDKSIVDIARNNTHSYQDEDTKDLARIAQQLIKELPEKQRLVVHLRDVEGYSFEEIADIIEIDINAVRMNLSRARHSLKGQLDKICNYGL